MESWKTFCEDKCMKLSILQMNLLVHLWCFHLCPLPVMSTWQLIVQSEGIIKKVIGHWYKLPLWRFAGVGIGVGVETSGVGVDILEIGRSWSWSWNLWSWSWSELILWSWQGWGEYYSGTRLVQNDTHFPVLVLVCWVLAPALGVDPNPVDSMGDANFHGSESYRNMITWHNITYIYLQQLFSVGWPVMKGSLLPAPCLLFQYRSILDWI